MCRDYIRDDFYFEECIRFTQERINKFEEAFKKLDDSQTEQRRYCLEVIAGFEKNMIHLMYSAGRKKAENKRGVQRRRNLSGSRMVK